MKTAINLSGNEIKVGSTWQEVDERFKRYVRVVDTENSGWGKVTIENLATGRRTKAAVERFNGRSHGYEEVVFFTTDTRPTHQSLR